MKNGKFWAWSELFCILQHFLGIILGIYIYKGWNLLSKLREMRVMDIGGWILVHWTLNLQE
jgi:hypothetical protein